MDFFFEQGVAQSTKKTYESAWRRFQSFCTKHNIATPLPVTQSVLCSYAAYLVNEGLSHQSIKTYMSAILFFQIKDDWPEPPPMPKLKVVNNGIKKVQAVRPPARIRLPITPPILRRIRVLWSSQECDRDIIMLWAACTVCFFGFFRAGEVTVPAEVAYDTTRHLSFKDLAVDNPADPTLVRVRLKFSKTNQLGKGAEVFLGHTNDDLCPVAAVRAYLAVRGSSEGPLFKFADGRYLIKERFTSTIHTALQQLGLASANYAGHSFRIGAATTAAQISLEDSTIQALGRWHSDAFKTYVRLPKDFLTRISASLAGSQLDSSMLPAEAK